MSLGKKTKQEIRMQYGKNLGCDSCGASGKWETFVNNPSQSTIC